MFFDDISYLNPSIYFEKFTKFLNFIQIYENDEPKLMVSLALVLNLIENNGEFISQITQSNIDQLKNLIKKQNQYDEDEKIMAFVIRINDLVNLKNQIQEKKYDVFDL